MSTRESGIFMRNSPAAKAKSYTRRGQKWVLKFLQNGWNKFRTLLIFSKTAFPFQFFHFFQIWKCWKFCCHFCSSSNLKITTPLYHWKEILHLHLSSKERRPIVITKRLFFLSTPSQFLTRFFIITFQRTIFTKCWKKINWVFVLKAWLDFSLSQKKSTLAVD